MDEYRKEALETCMCGHHSAAHDPWPDCVFCDCREWVRRAGLPHNGHADDGYRYADCPGCAV